MKPRSAPWLALALGLAACRTPPATDPAANVLLITLDTTRADHLGAYGHATIATPALDGLAREGVRFTRATTAAPLTLPAHTSLLTGNSPLVHGVRDNSGFFLASGATTLAEALSASGTATGAVLGSFILQRGWGLDQGFDHYDDLFDGVDLKNAPAAVEVQRPAAEVVDRGIAWIEAQGGRRFLAWLHFYDAHTPYEPPGEYAVRYAAEPYAGEIAYVDGELARLFDWLRSHDLYEKTLIVVAGDHGEALGEHGEPDHGIFLYEGTLHVPLIVRAPRQAYRGVVDALVRDIDVMPTILDYLQLPAPPALEGSSLLPLMAGRPDTAPRQAYAETFYARFHYGWSELQSLRDERYKYVRAPRPELYDLERDRAESYNVIEQHPGIAADLAERLEALIQGATADAAATPAPVDPDTLARLQSLGYVGSIVRVEGALADPKDKAGSLELFARVGHWGTRYLTDGRFADAVRLADEALAVESNYLDGHQLKARGLLGLGRPDEARRVLEAALRLNPDDLGTLLDLARSHAQTGGHRTALDLLERARALSPEYAGAYLLAADSWVALDRPDEALRLLEALLGVDPQSAISHYEIGRLRLQRGDLDGARESIEQAAALRDLLGAHFNLALIAERQGDGARARAQYEREVAAFPRNHEAWTNLGLLCMNLGRVDAGVAAFEHVVALQPDLHVGYVLLARAYLTQGRPRAEVAPLARQALELAPDSAQARALAAELGGGS